MVKKNSPIFITGLWRSGTTLISRIINTFPDYQVTYDTIHFMRYLYDDLKNEKNLKKKIEIISKCEKRLNQRYNLKADFSSLINKLKKEHKLDYIYNGIMRCLFNNTNQWGEKSNLQSHNIENFLKIFPNGYVILMIRDPRAVLNSWKKYTYVKGNEYLNSIFNSYVSLNYANKLINNKRVIVVKYEDLINNPSKTINKICKIVKNKFDKNYLNFKNYTDIHKNQWNTNSVYKSKNNFDKNKINNWKKDLNISEIFITEFINHSQMKIFSYQSYFKNRKIRERDYNLQKLIKKNSNFIKNLKLFFSGKLKLEKFPNNPKVKKNWSSS